MHVAFGLSTLALTVCAACGSNPAPAIDTHIGMTTGGDSPIAPQADGAIELALRRSDGTFIDVGDLRGSVVVLFVFATFDGVSQMTLRPLESLVSARPDVRVVGIAAQPSARLLVDAYEHALSPPFPITYDPEERVQTGESSLGPIEGIPTLIVLDARGLESARHVGFIEDADLGALVAAAE